MKNALLCILALAVSMEAAPAKDTDPAALIRQGIERRIAADVDSLRQVVDQSTAPKRQRKRMLKEIDRLEKEFRSAPPEVGPDFRAVLPLNPLHASLFRVQAACWKAQGLAPLLAWQADLWGDLTLWEPPAAEAAPKVDVRMMANEYRAGAFNVSNASQEDVTLAVRISGMPGGTNPADITVHLVEWTDTRTGRVVAAALPEAAREGDAYVVSVPSGLTRQVWLTFHPTDTPAGTYTGHIELSAGAYAAEIPLSLQVYPLRFPDQPALHFGGWDYTGTPGVYGVSETNIEAFLAHCRDRFVDSPWEGGGVIPAGTYDEKGHMTAEPDTAAFDAWITRWPNARRLCMFPNVGESFSGFKLGTPEFEQAVHEYAAFWARHAQARGFKPEQVSWLLSDEPSGEKDALIVAWAKTIRAAQTGIQIWEDPIHPDMSKADPNLGAACHILCPNRTMFLSTPEKYAQYFLEQRDKGATLEFYSCRGPARLLDPYAYYRMQAWSCWQHGAISSNFWALGDNAGVSSWNEYIAPRTAYAPFFIDAASITAGKHMEACREGIEDYEYLRMLRQAVESAEGQGRKDDETKRARALLDGLPARVLNPQTLDTFWWRTPLDRTVADAARIDILDVLSSMNTGAT